MRKWVVIDHGEGWETQYCHMRKGSIAVNIGDAVRRGQRLGDVGYSGLAQFAHLHLAVRHKGSPIDPFSGRSLDGSCTADATKAQGLWDDIAAKGLTYHPGEVFAAAFAGVVPNLDALERHDAVAEPKPTSAQLVFFSRALNIRKGDRIRLTVKGPGGFDLENLSEPLPRNKASYLAYAGRRRTAPVWPAGLYEGHAEVLRGGAVVSEMWSKLSLTD
jgi:murein DD-endopeptidase MepM/ murein hydrolase activator NlpD